MILAQKLVSALRSIDKLIELEIFAAGKLPAIKRRLGDAVVVELVKIFFER